MPCCRPPKRGCDAKLRFALFFRLGLLWRHVEPLCGMCTFALTRTARSRLRRSRLFFINTIIILEHADLFSGDSMSKNRAIIKINEELCNGCGVCLPSCAEGALRIENGKLPTSCATAWAHALVPARAARSALNCARPIPLKTPLMALPALRHSRIPPPPHRNLHPKAPPALPAQLRHRPTGRSSLRLRLQTPPSCVTRISCSRRTALPEPVPLSISTMSDPDRCYCAAPNWRTKRAS